MKTNDSRSLVESRQTPWLTTSQVSIPLHTMLKLPDTLASQLYAHLSSSTLFQSANPDLEEDEYWFSDTLQRCDTGDPNHQRTLLRMTYGWSREIITQVWTHYLPHSSKVVSPENLEGEIDTLHERVFDKELFKQRLQRHTHDVYDYCIHLIRKSAGLQATRNMRLFNALLDRAAKRNRGISKDEDFVLLKKRFSKWSKDTRRTWANHHLSLDEIQSQAVRHDAFLQSFNRMLERHVARYEQDLEPSSEEVQAQRLMEDAEKMRSEAQVRIAEADRMLEQAKDELRQNVVFVSRLKKEARKQVARFVRDSLSAPDEQREVERQRELLQHQQLRETFLKELESLKRQITQWGVLRIEAQEIFNDCLSTFDTIITDEDQANIEEYLSSLPTENP